MEGQQLTVERPPHIVPRNVAHTITDYGYLFSGPYEMDAAGRVRLVQWVQEKREVTQQQNRWLVTVAILGQWELAHGRVAQTLQGFCLCSMGEQTACRHSMQPTLLILNFSSNNNSWENFRQQEVVNRLANLKVDILLLAPGEASLAAELVGTPLRESVVRWRRQLPRTTITLQAAVFSPRPRVVANLPKIIVVLPGRGKCHYTKRKTDNKNGTKIYKNQMVN